VNLHRQTMFGGFVHDYAQLAFRVNLLSGVGLGQPGSLRATGLNHVNATIDIDVDQKSQLII